MFQTGRKPTTWNFNEQNYPFGGRGCWHEEYFERHERNSEPIGWELIVLKVAQEEWWKRTAFFFTFSFSSQPKDCYLLLKVCLTFLLAAFKSTPMPLTTAKLPTPPTPPTGQIHKTTGPPASWILILKHDYTKPSEFGNSSWKEYKLGFGSQNNQKRYTFNIMPMVVPRLKVGWYPKSPKFWNSQLSWLLLFATHLTLSI